MTVQKTCSEECKYLCCQTYFYPDHSYAIHSDCTLLRAAFPCFFVENLKNLFLKNALVDFFILKPPLYKKRFSLLFFLHYNIIILVNLKITNVRTPFLALMEREGAIENAKKKQNKENQK